MPRVALLSDTHVPSRAPELPQWVRDALGRADHTIHAGDFDSPEAHFEVSVAAGGDLTAVRGNMDPALELPQVATYGAGGIRFVVTHGDGPGREAAYQRALETLANEHEADVAVAGHTHRVMDTCRDGVRLLNPGSATGAAPAGTSTLMMVDCVDGTVDVTLHGGLAH